MKAQEDQNQINVEILESLIHIFQKVKRGSNTSLNRKGRNNTRSIVRSHTLNKSLTSRRESWGHYRRRLMLKSPSPRSCDSHTVRSGERHSPKTSQRTQISKGILHGEFWKARPPPFDGVDVTGPTTKAWLFGMERYFKIHDYAKNEKVRIVVFYLSGRALIWWEHLVQVKGIVERKIDWGQS